MNVLLLIAERRTHRSRVEDFPTQCSFDRADDNSCGFQQAHPDQIQVRASKRINGRLIRWGSVSIVSNLSSPPGRLRPPRRPLPRLRLTTTAHPCSKSEPFNLSWGPLRGHGSDTLMLFLSYPIDTTYKASLTERGEGPLRGRASGSNDLPWALPRVLQAILKIKRAADANGWCAGPAPCSVCSKDLSSTFVRACAAALLQRAVPEVRRGPGRGGKPRRDTGTATGKQQRNGQSQRYRERVKNRKPPAEEAVPEVARVIPKKFFRRLL